MPLIIRAKLDAKRTGVYDDKEYAVLQFVDRDERGGLKLIEVNLPNGSDHSAYVEGKMVELAISVSPSGPGERGLGRFEVLGRDADRDLIRALARRLAEDGPAAAQLRTALERSIDREPRTRGNILAALRRSPLVDSHLDLSRASDQSRAVEI